MELAVRQVTLVRMRVGGGEDVIVLAPDNQRRRLALPEEGLDGGIERQVGAIAVEDDQLDVGISRSIEQRLVVNPVVWREAAYGGDTVGGLKFRGICGHERAQRKGMVVRAVRPIHFDRSP